MGYVLDTEQTTLQDDVTTSGSGGITYTQVLQPHRMYGAEVFGQSSQRTFSKTWQWANVLATLTAGATAPICVQTSARGTPSTTTFSGLVSVPMVYYQPSGPYGPFLDIVITDTSTGASEYANITVLGKALGQR